MEREGDLPYREKSPTKSKPLSRNVPKSPPDRTKERSHHLSGKERNFRDPEEKL